MGIWRSDSAVRRRKKRQPLKSRNRFAWRSESLDTGPRSYRGLHLERFEERMLLSVNPTLVSITTNDGDVLVGSETLDRAPRELVFRFNEGQIIDPATLGGIRLVRAGNDGNLGTADDVPIVPGFVGIGDRPNEVVYRFAETLPDDLYRVTIVGSGAGALRNTSGATFNNGINHNQQLVLDLGPQVLAVVPQPVSRNPDGTLSQARDQIVVYFDQQLDPAAAQNPAFYQLIATRGTATTEDDLPPILPTSVVYNSAANTATLNYADDLAALAGGSDTLRLRIGTDEAPILEPQVINPAVNPGSSITTALSLGTLGDRPRVVNEEIFQLSFPLSQLTLPGGINEPGHRDINAIVSGESHFLAGQDSFPGITTIPYNFRDDYGTDPQGNPLENLITENQKERAREVFALFGHFLGVQFYETERDGITVATGDPRALNPSVPSGPTGVGGIAGGGRAIMNAGINWGNSEFGGSWFRVAIHEIGHLLGLGHSYELPPANFMGDDNSQAIPGVPVEPVFPGDNDIIHGQHVLFPVSTDIDLYSFMVTTTGVFRAEVFAERMADSSLLDATLTLFDSTGTIIAHNDDYFGNDAFLEVVLDAGLYYVGVAASGSTPIDPRIEDSVIGGTSWGEYQLRVHFEMPANEVLVSSTGTQIDGNLDGTPGGVFNFWFDVTDETTKRTVFVDKAAVGGGGPIGSLANPYTTISAAIAAANQAGSNIGVIRIVGNGGADGNLSTLGDNLAYEIGRNTQNQPLADGATFNVPKDVTVMIDAGAIVKLRRANISVGSLSQGIDRSGGALQVLGTPEQQVIFTSWLDESIGLDTYAPATIPTGGDWGGIVFRNDFDRAAGHFIAEDEGIFLNIVNQATIQYAGGPVVVDSVQQLFTPIHMTVARPTLTFNTLKKNSNAAISADPDSFEESLFVDATYMADYRRVGPHVRGNVLGQNGINGLLVRTTTPSLPGTLVEMTVSGRFDDTDIVHVLTENLLIAGNPGGPILNSTTGLLDARTDGRLAIDGGVVVKLNGARIETRVGAQFIAEAQAGQEVVFTSLFDDRFGRAGTFDTDGTNAIRTQSPGDWGGLFFGHLSTAHLDHVLVTMAGGTTSIEGDFAEFNPIEIHQAEVRIAHSVLRDNASGFMANPLDQLDDRNGRGWNEPAALFVRGAQPVIVDNVFRDNMGSAISINVNSLNHAFKADPGRTTGLAGRYSQYDNNRGPLIGVNTYENNGLNGMKVRGGVLTTESIWDDVDVVHVVLDPIDVQNHHTFSGLRLHSQPTQSLIIKLAGENAGLTAKGTPLEINDRIGGTLQVVGFPGAPVVLTALNDDTIGAGLNLAGRVQTDTANSDGDMTTLPTLPNVPMGTLIDNNVPVDVVGYFAVDVRAGGESFSGGITAQGRTQLFTNADFIFEYLNYVDVGSNGSAVQLSQTNITAPATLIGEDLVASAGTFMGENGPINWTARSQIQNGSTRFETEITFQSNSPLGNLRLINYLDEDIGNFTDDLLYLVGAPGSPEFRAFTLDGPERVGFSQGGIYTAGPGLQNATYDGFAADVFASLRAAITGPGTQFAPEGNINLATLPAMNDPELGTVFGPGDVTTAFAWSVDPTANTATITVFLEAVPENPGATAGSWRSLRMETFSNDRNLETVIEQEKPLSGGFELNSTPDNAQFLGELAPNQKAGDDNRRLGFEVHGFISPDFPGDIDVYSFIGYGGTEVWFDVDLTSHSLDAVLELIDADGNVLARSINSINEAADPSLHEAILPGNLARLMQRDDFRGDDFYTINPRDPGMRVVLPGPQGAASPYFVRIRSNSPDLEQLDGGVTRGAYQLQIRLQEVNEFPGSTIRYADIRYATNGIEIAGAPFHSPLIGESASLVDFSGPVPVLLNNSPQTAVDLGNLLASDRNTMSVAGAIFNPLEANWYKFTLELEQIQRIGGFTDGGKTFPLVFDIDYADGMSRPDTVLAVYAEDPATGELVPILLARDSNISDDQPRPGHGADTTNNNSASFNVHDPYLGSVHLPEGASRTYYVAVASNAVLPAEIASAYFTADPVNPLVRLQPIHGVERIVDDRIGRIGYVSGSGGTTTNVNPTTPAILPIDNAIQLQTHVRPFTLSDVTLFASQAFLQGGPGARLVTIDPYTGVLETAVGPLGFLPNDFHDIVIRDDGQMFGYQAQRTVGTFENTAGQLVHIDPGNADEYVIGRDNIPDDADDEAPDDPQTLTTNTIDALVYRRAELVSDLPEDRYALYYSVRDFLRGSSRLYRADPKTGDANPQTGTPYGVVGNIISDDIQYRLRAQVDPLNELETPGAVLEDEGDGAVTVRVFRDDPGSILPLEVTLVSSRPDIANYTGDPVFIAPNGFEDFDIDVFDNDLFHGTRTVVFTPVIVTGGFFDYAIVTDSLDVLDDETEGLSLTLSGPRVAEQPALLPFLNIPQFVTGTVTRDVASPDPLLVELHEITGRVRFTDNVGNPISTVTIPAGQTSATFRVVAVNDGQQNVINPGAPDLLTQRSEEITILALSQTHGPARADLTVVDSMNNNPVTGPSVFTIFDGTSLEGTTGTRGYARSGLVGDVYIVPFSSDPRVEFLEEFVLMPAGQNTAQSTYRVVDDAVFTGYEYVILTGQAFDENGNFLGTYRSAIVVEDNDLPTLSLTVAPTIVDENAGLGAITGTVTRDVPLTFATTVTIVSHDPALITAPTTVTIPAGQASAQFSMNVISGNLTGNGGFTANDVKITALKDGFLSSSEIVTVTGTTTNLGFTTGMEYIQFVGLSLLAPTGAQIGDGQTFSISDAVQTVTFEFDNDGTVTPGNVPVPFSSTDFAFQVADSMRAAINGSALQVDAQPGGSLIQVLGAFGADEGTSLVDVFVLPNNGFVLFGVSDLGHFFTIDEFTGRASVISSFGSDIVFSGLTIGPQNLAMEDDLGIMRTGALATTLFASTLNGDIYAIDALNGTFRTDVFAGGAVRLQTGLSQMTGLAFSPLDFNLWHPTIQDATVPGHGVMPAFDNSVHTSADNLAGGASYYFGMEPLDGGYIPYAQLTRFGLTNQGTQYGIELTRYQDRLTENFFTNLAGGIPNDVNAELWATGNTIIGNNYNLPGGAHGSLIANPFSLEGYDPADKPTLYFNYFLETEGAAAALNQDTMRDAARVFASIDGGNTWIMLATNNSVLNAELPTFLSASTNLGNDSRQIRQELFDQVDDPETVEDERFWRQARVDLSQLAGETEIILRFDFSTSGVITDPSSPNFNGTLPGDQFGNFGNPERGQDNNFRGFFIDDIIVGFAERGEMITGALPLAPENTVFAPVPPTPVGITQILNGPFQLEIRRGTETQFVTNRLTGETIQGRQYDTNDRLTEAFTFNLLPGQLIQDGQTFIISDGLVSKTFEFDIADGVTPGNVAVPFVGTETPLQMAQKVAGIISSEFGPTVSARVVGEAGQVDLFGVAFAELGPMPHESQGPSSALDDYVAAFDPTTNSTLVSTLNGADFTAYVIDLTSQTWRPADVSPSAWQHWVTVIVPDNVQQTDTALLHIHGGSNPASQPTLGSFASGTLETLLGVARDSGSIVISLPTIPNQSLLFTNDAGIFLPPSGRRSEDNAIAYTFDQFIETGDEEWPLLLPMVKSVFSAMDAVQDELPALGIDNFILNGGSKRGWTTYLAGAVDANLPVNEQRVSAIMPMVFDFSNFDVQLRNHRAFYEGNSFLTVGGFSISLIDYVMFGLTDVLLGTSGIPLTQIVDPYEYRDRLTMPKYLVNSTGDEFFVSNSSQYYVHDLPGPTYLRYVPNTGHGLNDQAVTDIRVFYEAIVNGTQLPQFTWTVTADQTLIVETIDEPLEVNLWTSTNPLSRDFRWFGGIGPEWTSTTLEEAADGLYIASQAIPANGARAFMVELVYDSGGPDPFRFTTDVVVLSNIPLNVVRDFGFTKYEFLGDTNLPREQGQLFIHSNMITHSAGFGISVTADDRERNPNLPHVQSVRNLPTLNNQQLVPGITIENNVIAYASGEGGGILISGDTNVVNGQPVPMGAVPFVRVVNNTIYGNVDNLGIPTAGVGIAMTDNVSPTLLNNIVSGFQVGIAVSGALAAPPVVGGTLYQNNLTNTNVGILGDFAIVLGPTDPLFVDAANGNFQLAAGSLAIDSAIDALQERPALAAVTSPLGIPPSPILAPDRDLFGQFRQDDPTTPTPPGMGGNAFKDRGAIERVVDSTPPQMTINDRTVFEGDEGITVVTFTVQLSTPTSQAVTVQYTTTPASALAGVDYVPAQGVLFFAPGQTIAEITVGVIGNIIPQPDRTFYVDLFNPVHANLVKSRGVGTIVDDDPTTGAPVITIDDLTVVEGNFGTTGYLLAVRISHFPETGLVSVNYATADGTATAFVDYTPVSGTLVFQQDSNPLVQHIPIQIRGNTIVDGNRSFFVNLTGAVNGIIGKAQSTITIIDDDVDNDMLMFFEDTSINKATAGYSIETFTVMLTAPASEPTTVNYATANGTAIGGVDFVHRTGSIVFNPGETSKNISLLIKGNTVTAPHKQFFVNLDSPNTQLATTQGVITILGDGDFEGPTLVPPGPKTVVEGSTLSLTPQVVNPGGVPVTFALGAGAPQGATINPTTGLFEWTPSDNTATPVPVTIELYTGGATPVASTTFHVTVTNAAPSVEVVGPVTGVRGQPRTFTLVASDPSPIDEAGTFTFDIDFNGDGIVDQTVVGPSGMEIEHVFTTSGSYAVLVTATDKDGGTSTVTTHDITITDHALQPNPNDPGKMDLVFGGTMGVDAFIFLPGGAPGSVIVYVQFLDSLWVRQPILFSGVTGDIVAYGQGGTNVFIAELMTMSVEFHGGPGNDVLVGGRGDDRLFGGDGNDILFGSTSGSGGNNLLHVTSGRNLLFGHLGADTLIGGTGEDLFVSGQVNFPMITAAVFDIQAEWVSDRDYATRVANLSGTGSGPRANRNSFLIPGETVMDDTAVDTLLGGSDLNWFLMNEFEDVADNNADEIVTHIGS